MKLRLSGEPTFHPPGAEATPPRLWQQPFALCGIWLAGGLGVPIASLATAVVRALGVEAPEGFRSNHWAAGLALWLPSSALTIVVTLWWVRTLERRSLASAGLARASVRAQGR